MNLCKKTIAFCIFSMSISLSQASDVTMIIYTWHDEKGVLQVGDTYPEGVVPDAKIFVQPHKIGTVMPKGGCGAVPLRLTQGTTSGGSQSWHVKGKTHRSKTRNIQNYHCYYGH